MLQTYPLVYIMMTRKTQKAYEHALRYVHENVFPLRCEAMITDYEIGMRKAVREVVPDIKQLGCWFHYAQAIRRKIASLSALFILVRTDEKIRNIYYKIICLALLPHDKIEKAFNELALEGLQLTKEFTPFVKYFQNQWLKRVGVKGFSVFLEETRTTCAAEGYNGKLGKRFRTHPNFFVFIESLQWEELAKSNALEQHINGAKQTQPKKEYRERAALIRNESMKFTIPKQTNAQLFLNRVANIKNHMLPAEFQRFEDIVEYTDETEEVLDDILNEVKIDSKATSTKTTTAKSDVSSKTSKKTQKATHSNERIADSRVTSMKTTAAKPEATSTKKTTAKSDVDSKTSKKTQKSTHSNEKKADSRVTSVKTTAAKPDDSSKTTKQNRKGYQSKDPLPDEHMTRERYYTRSQSKKIVTSGQN